jgi:hypothetical protein
MVMNAMAQLSPASTATASNSLQAGLRAVAAAMSATPLDALGAAIGKDDSTACRIRSEEAKVTMSDALRLLYAAGFKAVPAGKVCVDRARYEAMVTIASAAMADEQTARRLTWDEA